jgi:DNA/RNA-binding domain of Phe-tRNA-synthetase-like protein
MTATRTKTFTVSQGVWDRYPGMKLVCLSGSGLDNTVPRPLADQFFQSTQLTVFETMRGIDLDSYAPLTEWRHVQPGPEFPAAHEALAKRVAAGKMLKHISPFVDWYNACCLDLLAREIAAPIGAWCSDIVPTLSLCITAGGEPFIELGGKAKPIQVEAGETAYIDLERSELITRHFVWRQSQRGSIGPRTRSFFLVSEIIEPFADRAEMVCGELVKTCEQFFSIRPRNVILTAARPSWHWTEGH